MCKYFQPKKHRHIIFSLIFYFYSHRQSGNLAAWEEMDCVPLLLTVLYVICTLPVVFMDPWMENWRLTVSPGHCYICFMFCNFVLVPSCFYDWTPNANQVDASNLTSSDFLLAQVSRIAFYREPLVCFCRLDISCKPVSTILFVLRRVRLATSNLSFHNSMTTLIVKNFQLLSSLGFDISSMFVFQILC